MSRTGMPAIVRDSMCTGKAASEASPARVCQASVPVRRWARVSWVAASEAGRARPAWACGLMVLGTGTTRVMWAVPPASMWLELVWIELVGGAVGCCARAMGIEMAARAKVRVRCCDMRGSFGAGRSYSSCTPRRVSKNKQPKIQGSLHFAALRSR